MSSIRLTQRKTATRSSQLSSESSSDETKTHSQVIKKTLHVPSLKKVNVIDNNKPPKKLSKNVIQRTIWTFVMLFGFFSLLAAGHIYAIGLIFVIQIVVFKEILSIAYAPAKEKKIPGFKLMNYYFLATAIYFSYGETAVRYFKHALAADYFFRFLASHHKFISYIMYLIGFAIFVVNLRAGHYKFQFAQFCWTHMTLFLVDTSSHFVISNILEGMFWFVVPAGLVISNDIFAYICGKIFGRTQLIALSPRKTVEGFIGAWFFTAITGAILTELFSRHSYLICPVKTLDATFFSGMQCKPNPVFLPREFELPLFILNNFRLAPASITIRPIHFHVAVLSTFASLFAPFGGFFASGLKRAFKIKDFGDSIPGHGGLTDRFDCQFLNGSFVYVYFNSFIIERPLSVDEAFEKILFSLSLEEQLNLTRLLLGFLASNNVIDSRTYEILKSVNLVD